MNPYLTELFRWRAGADQVRAAHCSWDGRVHPRPWRENPPSPLEVSDVHDSGESTDQPERP